MQKLLFFTLIAALLTACSDRGGNTTKGIPAIAGTAAIVERIKPTINVYIENSSSMDGYVKGVTEFEMSVYNYLSDIKMSGISDSLNLFYINSEVIPQGSDIEDFIKKLEPSTFKQKGGNRGSSDIANVLGDVLLSTKENNISILVTDGIFSPGKGVNAEEYLVNQQIGIKNRSSDFLKKEKDAAVIAYQLSSKFDGTYYNKVDAKIPINEPRPFYIYVIGKAQYLTELCSKVPSDKFNGNGVQHIFSITTGNKTIKYAINPSIGKFKKSKDDTKNTIERLKKDRRTGKVKFAVNVDFSELLLDNSYLLDANNYENSSKYDLEIKQSTTKGKGYTHTLNFSSDKVYKGTLIVKLKTSPPAWVDEVNDNDGLTAVAGKTYGIKYQIDGIFDAFTFDNKYYTEIKININ